MLLRIISQFILSHTEPLTILHVKQGGGSFVVIVGDIYIYTGCPRRNVPEMGGCSLC